MKITNNAGRIIKAFAWIAGSLLNIALTLLVFQYENSIWYLILGGTATILGLFQAYRALTKKEIKYKIDERVKVRLKKGWWVVTVDYQNNHLVTGVLTLIDQEDRPDHYDKVLSGLQRLLYFDGERFVDRSS